MARIAIAHTDLMAKGGGEGVCINALEALQGDHEVTLFSLAEPDWAALEAYYDADLGAVDVRSWPVARRALELADVPLYNLRTALLSRLVRRHEDEFDLVVGTDSELSVDSPCIQYIHTPRFGRLVTTKRVGEDSFVDHLYDRLSYLVGGYDAEQIRSSVLLTNSRFVANIVQDTYGVRPRVVHPPVDTGGFEDVPWDEREPGFLTVGRLSAYKNVETTIRIADGLRDRGHDDHQHIVGPASDPDYHRRIRSMVADRDYVTLEGGTVAQRPRRVRLHTSVRAPREAQRALRDSSRGVRGRWDHPFRPGQRRPAGDRRARRPAVVRDTVRRRREDRRRPVGPLPAGAPSGESGGDRAPVRPRPIQADERYNGSPSKIT